MGELRTLWRAILRPFSRIGGRTLRPTASGRLVLIMALAVGFAAMNTGNNLLFFGWGLVLSSIVISGILSESTLRAALVTPLPPDELRAASTGRLPVQVDNPSRFPAFGVAVSFVFDSATRGQEGSVVADEHHQRARSGTTFELRLSPGATRVGAVPWTPPHRGVYAIESLRVATAAPFGFFSKERIFSGTRLSAGQRNVVVMPERVDTRLLGRALWARLGEAPSPQVGIGDEFFSLRPFREGDDPRRVAWRRSAKTGRPVVRENEATQSREVIVALRAAAGADVERLEDGIATVGSLVEDLLADGHAVGVVVGDARLSPARGSRQRVAVLEMLARVDARGVSGGVGVSGGAAVIVVVAVGAVDVSDANVVVEPVARARTPRPA